MASGERSSWDSFKRNLNFMQSSQYLNRKDNAVVYSVVLILYCQGDSSQSSRQFDYLPACHCICLPRLFDFCTVLRKMLPIYGEMHSTVSVMRQMQFAELQQEQQRQLATTFSYGITLFVCASCSWYACVWVCRMSDVCVCVAGLIIGTDPHASNKFDSVSGQGCCRIISVNVG